MPISLISAAVLTAILMAVGQVMFKFGADNITNSSDKHFLFQVLTSPILLSACLVYALTILVWIWTLKQAPLSRVYPYTALAYVLTPLISLFILGEKFSLQLLLGYVFIITGIIICTSSPVDSHANY